MLTNKLRGNPESEVSNENTFRRNERSQADNIQPSISQRTTATAHSGFP